MTEPATLDAAAKQRVKDALTALSAAQVQASAETVAVEGSAAELDQESAFRVDDQSQSDEDGELRGLNDAVEERQQANLAQVEALDFGPKTVVEPGAIIAFGGDHYVVGVVASAFESDGVTYEGIAADSPIYAAIEGLEQGATFTFNDHSHTIDLVA